ALLLLLGLRGAADPTGPWWPAGAILTAGVVSAGLAGRQRREAWAFAAALSLPAAASLVLLHPFGDLNWSALWPQPLPRHVAAAAVAALLWLAAWRLLYPAEGPAAPLLTVQVLLVLAGTAALLAGPACALVAAPGAPLDTAIRDAGGRWGWLTVLLALAPAAWLFGHRLAGGLVHVVGGLAVGVGVLVACSVGAATNHAR